MKSYFTLLMLLKVFCVNAQVCSGGGAPSIVSFPIGGQSSYDEFDDPDNYSADQNASISGDVVAIEVVNLNLTTPGASFCSEAIITIADEAGLATSNYVDIQPSTNLNGSPCSDLPLSGLLVLTSAQTFPVGPGNQVHLELWETFDDDVDAVDATFTAGSTVLVYVCPVGQLLPIKLLSFDAKSQKNGNKIFWTTSSEFNNEYQAVMRSPDGKNDWIEIERVDGKNSSSIQNYNIIDKNPMKTSYYQLKSVDYDGQLDFSQVRVVTNEIMNSQNSKPEIIQNLNNNWQINLTSTIAESIQLTVYDIVGKAVITEAHNLSEGKNFLPLNVQNLHTGLYIIELAGNNFYSNQKIIK